MVLARLAHSVAALEYGLGNRGCERWGCAESDDAHSLYLMPVKSPVDIVSQKEIVCVGNHAT
jgi:hypothetical protein